MNKLYYRLTAWLPRPMPETKEDLEKLKTIFTQAFGLEDSPQVWYTVFANIASVKATSRTIYYASLVNIAKRLKINKVLQDQKILEQEVHMLKLVEEAKLKDESIVQSWTPDIQGDVPGVPEPTEGMVPLP